MFKIHEIREIIKLIDGSSIHEFKIEVDGAKISIKKHVAANEPLVVQASQPVAVERVAPPVASVPVAEQPVQQVQEAVAKQAEKQEDLDESSLHKIVSPMVGTFYRAPEPGAAPYVQVGDKVTPNKVVCIVEAMKLFNEIEAEVSGEIVKVLVEDGQLIEYGQPLFLVKPE